MTDPAMVRRRDKTRQDRARRRRLLFQLLRRAARKDGADFGAFPAAKPRPEPKRMF